MTRRALVTGGAGFIGSHLVDRLLQDGLDVRVLDDFSTGLRRNLEHVDGQIELVEGDIRDAGICRRACQGADVVFHLAALGSVPRSVADPVTSHQINIDGTLNMLLAARDAESDRFVFSASSSAYGDTEVMPKVETMPPRPLSPYAAQKVACEHYCAAFYKSYGLATVSLRYFNVFGPRQRPDGPYAAVVPKFFDTTASGTETVIFGDGEQSRDFTYVDNAVLANVLASQAGQDALGRVFNVAVGEAVTVNDLYATIAGLNGCAAKATHAPPRIGDVRHSLASLEASREVLGYEPQVGWREGLGRMARSR